MRKNSLKLDTWIAEHIRCAPTKDVYNTRVTVFYATLSIFLILSLFIHTCECMELLNRQPCVNYDIEEIICCRKSVNFLNLKVD